MNTNTELKELILPIKQGNNYHPIDPADHLPIAPAAGTIYSIDYQAASQASKNIIPVIKPYQNIPALQPIGIYRVAG